MNDAFGRPVEIGDEIATISDQGRNVLRGTVIRIGKGNFIIEITEELYATNRKTKAVPFFRSIKTGVKE